MLYDLPTELISIIFSYVIYGNIKDLTNIARICKKFRDIIALDEYDLIWPGQLAPYVENDVILDKEPELVENICRVYNITSSQITPAIMFKYVFQIKDYENCDNPFSEKSVNRYIPLILSMNTIFLHNVTNQKINIFKNINLLKNIKIVYINMFNKKNITYLDLQDIPDNITRLTVIGNTVLTSISEKNNLNVLHCSINYNCINNISNSCNLTNLMLHACYLDNIYVLKLAKLINLINISLVNNDICHISDFIYDMKKLESIEISKNKLNIIPPWLFNYINLKGLILEYNDIYEIQPSIKNLSKLGCLNISYNPIKYLPDELFELITLRLFILRDININTYPVNVNKLTNLISINNFNNNIKILQGDVPTGCLLLQ